MIARTEEREILQNRAGLEWSPSTGDTLEFCARQYYYKGIVAWGGWDPITRYSEEVIVSRKAYLLKQLKGGKAWAGGIVHDTIEYFLKESRSHPERIKPLLTELPHILRYAKTVFDKEWEDSLRKNDRAFHVFPKEHWRLQEHFFGLAPVGKELWDLSDKQKLAEFRTLLWQIVERSLTRFVNEMVPRILPIPIDHWLDVEAIDQKKGEIAHFTRVVEGVPIKIFSVLDFSYRDPHGRIVLVDWKSGVHSDRTEDKHRLQLAIYLMYAMQAWQKAQEDIIMSVAYLGDDTAVNCVVTTEGREINLESIGKLIDLKIAGLRSLFDDPNQAKARMESFPPTRPSAGKCIHCPFRPICSKAKDLEVPGHQKEVRTAW